MADNKIDFVVTYIDGTDQEWLARRNAALGVSNEAGNGEDRYRQWDNFKYWFRGVENFAPWVNKIYLVSDTKVPEWLNLDNDKLVVLRQEDFMPVELTPTFNSISIEFFFDRIPGLSEQFVYFNDDMYLTKPTQPEDFFVNGQPREFGVLGMVQPYGVLESIYANTVALINQKFDKRAVIKQNFNKFFNLKYGIDNIRNAFLYGGDRFTGFKTHHLTLSLLKQTYREVWETYASELKWDVEYKFRDRNQFTSWLLRYWQLATGNFVPQHRNFGKFFESSIENLSTIKTAIVTGKYTVVCLNDNDKIDYDDYVTIKETIISAFEQLYPNQSSFESEKN
ncbi:MAG: capsule biosynthesis protein CapK [Lactobacillaceae bacterium]|nr:capsule biosynthesis protein CapK [Lactobacillaceae bacterium]